MLLLLELLGSYVASRNPSSQHICVFIYIYFFKLNSKQTGSVSSELCKYCVFSFLFGFGKISA